MTLGALEFVSTRLGERCGRMAVLNRPRFLIITGPQFPRHDHCSATISQRISG